MKTFYLLQLKIVWSQSNRIITFTGHLLYLPLMMETDYDLEGFFHDVREDFGKTRESDVADGSRYMKMREVKEYVVSKKTKQRSKVKVKVKCVKAREKIHDIITPDQNQNKSVDSEDEIESNPCGKILTNECSNLSNKMPKNSELKSSNVQKAQKKVQIKHHLASSEDSDKVILDLTTKPWIEDLENLNNNNESNKSSPKTSSISTAPQFNNRNLRDRNRRREFSSHNRPRMRPKKNSEHEPQDRMAMSTWEESMSIFPELRSEIITGVTMISGELHFIVDWDGDRWRVKAEKAYKRIPMTCLKFYESLLVMQKI